MKGKNTAFGLKRGEWQTGMLAWGNMAECRWARAAPGPTVDTYTSRLVFYETPFLLTLTLKFNGDTVSIDRDMNVGGAPKPTPVTGKVG